MQKPDKGLRKFPLSKVIAANEKLQRVFLMHPDPIRHKVERKYCICKTKADKKMVCCDECDEWFHYRCVGISEEAAKAARDWRCGYCRSNPDDEGNRTWSLKIREGKRKRKTVALVRNDDDTPKALQFDASVTNMVEVGPKSWSEIAQQTQMGARKINLEEARRRKQAKKILNEGGHHVVDEVTLGGVGPRQVDGALVDDLLELGLLDGE